MRVKNIFRLIYGSTILLLILVATFAVMLQGTISNISENANRRYKSVLAADELMQTSEDLTKYCRTYIITGDPIWEKKYFDVVAIRSGEKARPDGTKKSLMDIMKELNFTDAEFAKMNQASQNSADLVRDETVAMNAVKGLFADANGNFTIKGEPNLALARDLVYGKKYIKSLEDIMVPLEEFRQLTNARTTKILSDSVEKGDMLVLIISIFVVILIATTIFSYVIINKKILAVIGGEPTEMKDIADKIADGDFSFKVDNEVHTGAYAALLTLSNNIKTLLADLNEMSHQHDLGDIDVVIDVNKYHNDFAVMTKGINDMVNGHIAVKKKAMACVKEFGLGNFDAELEKFPGKKAFINDTIEQVRANLKNVIQESNLIIDNISHGNVEHRGNVDNLNGDFKKIVGGMNNMLNIIGTSFEETMEVLERLAKGDLQARMVKEYDGAFEVLKQDLNTSFDSLPLNEIQSVMQAMANGDLTVNMRGDYQGDNLRIKEAVNNSIQSLNQILTNVKTTVDEVTHASIQVSDTSQALSQGATQQAASLEEITSSMNQIGSQTKLNAENAGIANTLASNARDAAEKGNTEMSLLTGAMNEINASSQSISKIIKVIDDIAFQTNLLALNAAVEAARAGRHGKGFAVVAEEVRSLAARSAKAAKETSEMIENSIKTVDRGAELVQKTGEALSLIQSESIKVADIIGEITTSSNEQAQGISQINEGLNQIDRVTQTNTASAEESASAAEELSGQASQLRELVDRFKLSGGGFGGGSMQALPSPGRTFVSSSRSLPSRPSHIPPVSEDDFMDLVNPNESSSSLGLDPRDVIKLDEDDFGRY